MTSTPPVANLSVRLLGAEGTAGLLAAAIETPVEGGCSAAWAVRVRGRMLSAAGPVKAIEAVAPGLLLGSARSSLPTPGIGAQFPDVPWAATCGFTLLVDTLFLRRAFEFRLRATLADDSTVDIALISGQRRALDTGYEPRLQPLLVNSFGRTGTTLLMQMLAAHPAIVVYARPPYEVRGSKYWLHMLKTLASPAEASLPLGTVREFAADPHLAGGNPFQAAEFAAWPQVEAWSGSAYVEDLAGFCQRSIDGFYLATAAAQEKAIDPLVYFAEKHFPDAYPRITRDLYPASRELFLVRDFRDMIASMQAYNARRGAGDFGRDRAGSDAAWLAYLHQNFRVLRNAWRDRGAPGSLVRYEDLVRDPAAALPPLLAYLGLPATPQAVETLLAAADAPELRGHGTAGTPAASIGRWRRDLSPELQRAVEAQFGDLLRDFGYELDDH